MLHGTTILTVRRDDTVVMGGDGQITMGDSVIKHTARKVRTLYRGKVLAGFAGSTADALTLFEMFEQKLEKHQGHLMRSAVELAKAWRMDKMLGRLEALLLVADARTTLVLTGCGDVIEPESGVMAIGSGGEFARAAAMALFSKTELSAHEIVTTGLSIAGDLCVYTNQSHVIVSLPSVAGA